MPINCICNPYAEPGPVERAPNCRVCNPRPKRKEIPMNNIDEHLDRITEILESVPDQQASGLESLTAIREHYRQRDTYIVELEHRAKTLDAVSEDRRTQIAEMERILTAEDKQGLAQIAPRLPDADLEESAQRLAADMFAAYPMLGTMETIAVDALLDVRDQRLYSGSPVTPPLPSPDAHKSGVGLTHSDLEKDLKRVHEVLMIAFERDADRAGDWSCACICCVAARVMVVEHQPLMDIRDGLAALHARLSAQPNPPDSAEPAKERP